MLILRLLQTLLEVCSLGLFRHPVEAVEYSPRARHMAQDKAKYQSFNPEPSGKTLW